MVFRAPKVEIESEVHDEAFWNVEDTDNPGRPWSRLGTLSRLQSAGSESGPFHGYRRARCLGRCSGQARRIQAQTEAIHLASARAPNQFARDSATRGKAHSYIRCATRDPGSRRQAEASPKHPEKAIVKPLAQRRTNAPQFGRRATAARNANPPWNVRVRHSPFFHHQSRRRALAGKPACETNGSRRGRTYGQPLELEERKD